MLLSHLSDHSVYLAKEKRWAAGVQNITRSIQAEVCNQLSVLPSMSTELAQWSNQIWRDGEEKCCLTTAWVGCSSSSATHSGGVCVRGFDPEQQWVYDNPWWKMLISSKSTRKEEVMFKQQWVTELRRIQVSPGSEWRWLQSQLPCYWHTFWQVLKMLTVMLLNDIVSVCICREREEKEKKKKKKGQGEKMWVLCYSIM